MERRNKVYLQKQQQQHCSYISLIFFDIKVNNNNEKKKHREEEREKHVENVWGIRKLAHAAVDEAAITREEEEEVLTFLWIKST